MKAGDCANLKCGGRAGVTHFTLGRGLSLNLVVTALAGIELVPMICLCPPPRTEVYRRPTCPTFAGALGIRTQDTRLYSKH